MYEEMKKVPESGKKRGKDRGVLFPDRPIGKRVS